MPIPIYFLNAGSEETAEDVAETEVAEAEGEETAEAKEEKKPQPINTPHPLWNKHPNDCTEEEYQEFSFAHIKFEMYFIYPSEEDEQEI